MNLFDRVAGEMGLLYQSNIPKLQSFFD